MSNSGHIRHGGVKFHTKMNSGLLFQKWSLGTQESFCKVSDQLDTWLNNYGLISRHNYSLNCVNNCTFIFKRHQPRLFLKALLVCYCFVQVIVIFIKKTISLDDCTGSSYILCFLFMWIKAFYFRSLYYRKRQRIIILIIMYCCNVCRYE